ncbi:UDP-glucuronosyltransferase 1-2-like [Neolamprologus brichardi]|uniref:UDP-glucuronosyltransferase 1-2-like n=1 Tax=Neolamprologus brichardi TaxID=32507 RepID=UPI0003EC13A2|nr:UDP-glucuronosyltransferase 1-2-like [Neolamprologus brichardi]
MGSFPGVSLFLLGTTLSLTVSPVQGGKILVFPVDGSHWLNMNLLIQSLHAKGHEVTVVRTATSWYVKEEAPHYSSITVTLPEAVCIEEQDFFVTFLVKILEIQKQGTSFMAVLKFYWEVLGSVSKIYQQASLLGVEIFENKTLMSKISDSNFDLVLLDPGLPVGVIVAHKLKLPVVFNVKCMTSGDGHFVIAPSPTSYVPTSGNAVSDKMTFFERVKNTFHYFLNTCIDKFIGIPLLFDQFENILRMEVRGAAKMVDVTKITQQNFLKVLQEVVNNPSYRNNMKRLSALHRDRPMHPLDAAVYWIEFVMRHKGAAHLRTESYKMPWYVYHSVDVICFLLAILFMLTAFVVAVIRFTCLGMCRRRKPKQE